MELGIRSDPGSHLGLRIGGIGEIVCPGVDIRQSDHGIGWLASSKMVFHHSTKFLRLGYPSMTGIEIKIWHLAGEPWLQKFPQCDLEAQLGFAFDENCDLHEARPPRRPICHN